MTVSFGIFQEQQCTVVFVQPVEDLLQVDGESLRRGRSGDCLGRKASSPVTRSCFCRLPRPRRMLRQVRMATPCTHVEYFDRPSNLVRLVNSRTNTS